MPDIISPPSPYTQHSALSTQHPPYVELHCHTNYSMLDGASHPEELVARARELGMDALAVTDHDGLYGAVRFWRAALEEGVRPIIGSEVTLDGGFHLTLLARDRQGYANLCRLISAAQLAHGKNRASLNPALLAEHSAGLICLSGCRKGEMARHLLADSRRCARLAAERYLRIFGVESFWIELQHHLLPEDDWLCDELADLADRLGVGCVATNDVHYALRDGHRLQDILVCIKNRTTLDASAGLRRPNSEYHLKSAPEMAALLQRYPGAVANSRVVAGKCHVDLNFKGYRFPGFQVPEGETPFSYLHRLCYEGARDRYRPITPTVSKQLAHELDVIQKTGLAEYFLIVWDIMRYAREQGIPGQGRGSAADSLVAYVLGITKVDPIRHDLLFERFLSEEMQGMPDIDIDFSTNHREQILQYVYQKYGEEHTGMVCNVVTYRARSALREVGKAMGLPAELLDRFAKAINHHSPSGLEDELAALTGAGQGLKPRAEKTKPASAGSEKLPNTRPSPFSASFRESDAVGRGLVPRRPAPDLRVAAGDEPPPYGGDLWNGASGTALTALDLPDEPSSLGPEVAGPPGAQHHESAGAGGPAGPTGDPGAGFSLGHAAPDALLPEGIVQDDTWRQLLEFCRQIEGFPRHLSIHVGGMLITAAPLVEIAPLERAAATGRVVVQFNKDDVEDMGLIKMDLLGLRTLSVIHDALEMIRESRGIDLDLDRVPLDDPAVFDMLCEPDNVGVFQIESRAQSQTLPRMQPRSIEDLIVEISIIRPGPIQGNMVHPYLRRRQGLEEVTYLHPSLEPVLKETLGVVLFQEQVIRVAVAVAGFTPGEADLFRRAMNRHRSALEMARIKTRFLDGARRNGIEEGTAEAIFRQLEGFASYGFCKSHAAAFAKTAYDTAYLKRYYAPEFYAAILNNQPMGFYSPEVVANDAKRHGIHILPVDVNRSRARCTVELREIADPQSRGAEDAADVLPAIGRGPVPRRPEPMVHRAAGQSALPYVSGGIESRDIRLGFNYVHGLGDAALKRLEDERRHGPYRSLRDFLRRTRLSRESVESLIAVGGMDCFGRPRRELLWEAGVEQGIAHHSSSHLDLPSQPAPSLPAFTPYDETAAEYSLMGVSVGRHAVELFRTFLEEIGAVPCGHLGSLPAKLVVRVGGLVVCEQAPPTAGGHVFLTLEDETGLANVILRPQVYQRFRRILHTNQIVLVEGLLQRQDRVTSLLLRKVAPLPDAALLAADGAKRPHRR